MVVIQCPTDKMAADIFTKPFSHADKWKHVLNLINHCNLSEIAWSEPKPSLNRSSGLQSPAVPTKPWCDMLVIEFCCGDDSKIGNECVKRGNCECQKLTINEDMSCKEGLEYALDVVRTAVVKGQFMLLWAAMPCTGGSPWQNYNKQFPKAAARIRKHIKTFNLIFSNFAIIAREVKEAGGIIVNEWPKACAYWRYSKVKKLFSEIMNEKVTVDGCSLGLK
jgi:hypothetical protein